MAAADDRLTSNTLCVIIALQRVLVPQRTMPPESIMHGNNIRISFLALLFSLFLLRAPVSAQQVIYDDSLQSGWQSYGWATLDYGSKAVVHSGADAISVTVASPNQALSLHHDPFDTSAYSALTFWINGGPTGGQGISVQAGLGGKPQAAYKLAPLAANTWQQVNIPLSALGVAKKPNMDGFWLQEISGAAAPVFYVDDIQLTALPPPALVHISVNGSGTRRALSTRLRGLNVEVWNSGIKSPACQSLVQAGGFTIMRWPGGSGSDNFDWSTNRDNGNGTVWKNSTADFVHLLSATSAAGIVTTNYGGGTPEMAAAWVAYFNGSPADPHVIGVDAKGKDWKTVGYWGAIRAASPLATDDGYNFLRMDHPASLKVQYYEIGNECFGGWENDQHGTAGSGLTGSPHDPTTYGQYAVQFIQAMKAVDPTVKVGCVAVVGEDGSKGGAHSVVNPNENNSSHSGWTPVMLSTMHGLSVLPDFLIDHRYPLSPGKESDSGLLSATAGWPTDAADLRKQITDYVGADGKNIELDVTETNDVWGNPGKQSVSLVDGLYAADTVGKITQTEFQELNWWDMQNGSDPKQNNSPSLYGWRNYGDYGLISEANSPDPANTPYPPYFAFKLLSHLIVQGCAAVPTTSDYSLLSAYGVAEPGGSLSLLVINKNPDTDLNAQIALPGFAGKTATVYSYGKDNDRLKSDLTVKKLKLRAPFNYTFPSYSMTVIALNGH